MPVEMLPLICYAEMSAPVRGFMLVWIACLGACVGSFLNVVVYRLPRGKSIVYPGSACPACENLIRWYHNIPILSWLMLRGRCFDCGAKISARYPVVEALVAGMLLALAYGETMAGVQTVSPTDTADAPWAATTVWAIFAYHGMLVCSLLCLALIESLEDHPAKLRLPWSLVLVPLAVGLLAPIALPELHPASASAHLPEALAASPALSAFSTGMLGLLLGLILGGLAWPATLLGPWGRRGAWFALAGSALVGTYLGGQAVCAVLLLTAVVHCVKTLGQAAWPSLRILTWPTILWVVTLLIILDGSALADRWPLLQSAGQAAAAIGGACAAVFVLSFGAWLVAREK